MKNEEVAKILREMALFLEMKGTAFKPAAYEKATLSIEALDEDISEVYKKGGIKALENIPAIGKGISERVEEYLTTGKIKDYEKLKKEIPVDVETLSAIEGIGPKLIKLFYQKLKIKNIDDLERAAKAGELAKLPRSGVKLQQKILKGIEFYRRSGARFLLGAALPLSESIEKGLKKVKGVEKVLAAGSLRRRQETIGDLDFLVACPKQSRKAVMDYFVSMSDVVHIFATGQTKSMVQLNNGISADARVVEKKSFGSALQYFTGNKDHNIALRKIAMGKGYKLNEYGLFQGKRYITGEDEEEIYKKLGLQWIPPEIRTNKGEIAAAQKNKLPTLIELRDIKGDLQVHSNWSDGANAIEEIAKTAQKIGYQYIAVTDHTRDLAMTHGSDEKKLLKQMKEIDKLNKKFQASRLRQGFGGQAGSKFQVLKGAEVNIRKDGSLDIEDKILAKLDIVGAAVHSSFNLSKSEETRRLIRAMENPYVDIILHPTARLIQKRSGIELDMDEIIKAAKRTGTCLEINSQPRRLDLKAENIRRAKDAGVKLSIGTDSHSLSELHYNMYGISQARAGWCEKKDIINSFSLQEILNFLKTPKNKRF